MNRQERQRQLIRVTTELVIASIVLGAAIVTTAAAIAADQHSAATVLVVLDIAMVWLVNRVAGALFAEIGVG